MVSTAKENTVKLNLSIKDAMDQPVSTDEPEPKIWLSWDYTPGENPVPKMAVDRDNIPIILWLPKFLSDSAHKQLLAILTEFGSAVENALSFGSSADSSGRNKKSAYRIAKGELAGCINLALWHAIGHEHTNAITSKVQLGSSARFSKCEQLLQDMGLASHRINEVLCLLDPLAYDSHTTLRKKLVSMYAHVKSRAAISPLLFQGQSYIYNRQTPNHFDRKEPKASWTPLFTAGLYTGGYLRIRGLGLRMWFGPGACIFLRGGLCPHEVEPFEGGQRISIAHFCHQSVWSEAGVEFKSSGIL